MMKMNIDLAVTAAFEVGDHVDALRYVLLLRVKENVLGYDPPVVPVLIDERGISRVPRLDPFDSRLVVGAVPQGLVVVDETKKYMTGPPEVRKPALDVAGYDDGNVFLSGHAARGQDCRDDE